MADCTRNVEAEEPIAVNGCTHRFSQHTELGRKRSLTEVKASHWDKNSPGTELSKSSAPPIWGLCTGW